MKPLMASTKAKQMSALKLSFCYGWNSNLWLILAPSGTEEVDIKSYINGANEVLNKWPTSIKNSNWFRFHPATGLLQSELELIQLYWDADANHYVDMKARQATKSETLWINSMGALTKESFQKIGNL